MASRNGKNLENSVKEAKSVRRMMFANRIKLHDFSEEIEAYFKRQRLQIADTGDWREQYAARVQYLDQQIYRKN